MGSKREKIKRVFSPSSNSSDPPPAADNEDEDLMDDLMAQLDSKDQTVQNEAATVLNDMSRAGSLDSAQLKSPSPTPQDSKARYRARQERKAASLAAQQSPDDPEAEARVLRETKEEEQAVEEVCKQMGLELHEVKPDGHCMFHAISDQLAVLGLIPSSEANYATTRHTAATYIFQHPDDFLPFLPSLSGEDGAGAESTGLMSPKDFETYCARIKDTGQWGGEPEILALSRAYSVPIHVVQSGSPRVVVHAPNGEPGDWRDPKTKAVWISYHRRMYGLGEHYNSLRPAKKSTLSKVADILS